ncbi:MAG: hypothetical protein ABI080_11500 [Candidatus Binatia bacterium]
MRTTLDIDEDVLRAAKELARRQKKTAGAVISELTRRALSTPPTSRNREPKAQEGFRPFPKRGAIVTNDRVDKLREDDVY